MRLVVMSRRPYSERAVQGRRTRREFIDQSYRSERAPRQQSADRREPMRGGNTRFRSELDRDFAAMKRVWQMLRYGAVRMIGEVGRQY